MKDKEYYRYQSPGGGTYRIPIPNGDETPIDKRNKELEKTRKEYREWEDRGEPIGW